MGQKWLCSKEWLLPSFIEECRVQFLKLGINFYFTQTGIFSMAELSQKTNNKQKCCMSWSQIAGSVLVHLRIFLGFALVNNSVLRGKSYRNQKGLPFKVCFKCH